MFVQQAIAAEDTWSDPFELRGDSHNRGLHARALVCASADDSTVTLRRLAGDKSTVLARLEFSSTMETVEVPVTGWYDVGVATGNYGGTPFVITVEQ